MSFGGKLMGIRKSHPQLNTRVKLSDASGVPRGTIRNYEQNKYDPTWKNAIKLACALGVSLDCFVDEESAKKTA